MSDIWKPKSERPPDGSLVAIYSRHPNKPRSWLSCEINFGEVCTGRTGSWYVLNNDYRGYGSETWDSNPRSEVDGFTHWCFITELPDMPDDVKRIF